jgi:hypothetical protein
VFGDVLDLQAEDGRPAPAASDAGPSGGDGTPPGGGSSAAGAGPVVADTYPLMCAAIGALSSPAERFEYGFGVLIDGLRARRVG